MANKYALLKEKQHDEFNSFPIRAAFSQTQFEEMMSNWGLQPTDTDKILSLGAGCYIRKTDREAFDALLKKLKQEKQDAIAADTTGDGFIKDMFLYELGNHEYCVTYDLEDTLDALGLTLDEINADKRLIHGLRKALNEYLAYSENY